MNLKLLFAVLIATVTSCAACHAQNKPPITDAVFSPDGKSLVVCSQTGLQVFSWPELRLQKTAKPSFANLHSLAFSADGKQIAVGGGNPTEEGIVEIFSWPKCESQAKLSAHNDSVVSLTWHGSKHLISASLDRSVIRWDLKTQKAVRTFVGHSRGVSSVCIVQDDQIVTAGYDHSVRVWDVKSGKRVRSLNQHTKPVNAIAVRPVAEGLPMIATAGGDHTIRFWQPTIGRMVRFVRLESEPLDIAWVSETRIVASCADGKARLVDTENVKVIRAFPAIHEWAYAIALHPDDGSIVVAGSNGQLQKLELDGSKK